MYVALEDTAGNVGIVLNSDANAAKLAAWTQWLTSLSDINAAGIPSDCEAAGGNRFMSWLWCPLLHITALRAATAT